jgi:hypothetical protein
MLAWHHLCSIIALEKDLFAPPFLTTSVCSLQPYIATLMSQRSDKNQKRTTIADEAAREVHATFTPPDTRVDSQNVYAGLKVISWSEIWASIAAAKLRGNTEMLKVFYDSLYKEAVFDDRGVWVLNSRPHD